MPHVPATPNIADTASPARRKPRVGLRRFGLRRFGLSALLVTAALLVGSSVAFGPAPAAQAYDTDFKVDVRTPHPLKVTYKWAASDDRFVGSAPTVGEYVGGELPGIWSSHGLNLVFWWAKNNTGMITYEVQYPSGPGERIIVAAVPAWGHWPAQANCVILPQPGQTAQHTCVVNGTTVTIAKRPDSLRFANHGGVDLIRLGSVDPAGNEIPGSTTLRGILRVGHQVTLSPLYADQVISYGTLTSGPPVPIMTVDYKAPTATSRASATCSTDTPDGSIPEHVCYVLDGVVHWVKLDLGECWPQYTDRLLINAWTRGPHGELVALNSDQDSAVQHALWPLRAADFWVDWETPGVVAQPGQTEISVILEPGERANEYKQHCAGDRLERAEITVSADLAPWDSTGSTPGSPLQMAVSHALMHAIGIGHPPKGVPTLMTEDSEFGWDTEPKEAQPFDIAAAKAIASHLRQ